MASRNFNSLQTYGTGVTLLAGNFATGAAGAVGAQVPTAGFSYTVTKPAGTGIYRLTVPDAFAELLTAQFTVFDNAAVDAAVQLQASDVSTGVYDLQVITASTGLALDLANAGVHFLLVLRNSSVTF